MKSCSEHSCCVQGGVAGGGAEVAGGRPEAGGRMREAGGGGREAEAGGTRAGGRWVAGRASHQPFDHHPHGIVNHARPIEGADAGMAQTGQQCRLVYELPFLGGVLESLYGNRHAEPTTRLDRGQAAAPQLRAKLDFGGWDLSHCDGDHRRFRGVV